MRVKDTTAWRTTHRCCEHFAESDTRLGLDSLIVPWNKNSKNLGRPITFSEDYNNNFNVFTVQNIVKNNINIGYIVVSENSNEIRTAINERKNFILRTVFIVGLVLLVFSFVLNKYFLKPIRNLVDYTKSIKQKDIKIKQPKNFIKRKDEIGQLSNSLNEITDASTEIYPNPANNSLNIVSYVSNINKIRIFNIKGEEVKYSKVNANQIKLNISTLAKGVYIIEIQSKNTNNL